MYIKSIYLENYRNHKKTALEGIKQTNIITGENASGKSNIVEAILRFNNYNKEKNNAVRFGSNKATINIEVKKGASTARHTLFAEKEDEKTRFKRKQPLGIIPIVCFKPSDNDLFNRGAQERRTFLDSSCSLIKKKYYQELTEYKKIIKQKNKALKEKNSDKTLINIFNEQLILRGEIIIKERLALLGEMEEFLQGEHRSISGNKHSVSMTYVSKTKKEDIRGSLIEQTRKHEKLEEIRRCCLVGPHRDDFVVWINKLNIAEFGSQGEKRTVCLSLKAVQIKMLNSRGVRPLLILDDALSELDEKRRQFLLEAMKECDQTFITATDNSGLNIEKNTKVYKIFKNNEKTYIN